MTLVPVDVSRPFNDDDDDDVFIEAKMDGKKSKAPDDTQSPSATVWSMAEPSNIDCGQVKW